MGLFKQESKLYSYVPRNWVSTSYGSSCTYVGLMKGESVFKCVAGSPNVDFLP